MEGEANNPTYANTSQIMARKYIKRIRNIHIDGPWVYFSTWGISSHAIDAIKRPTLPTQTLLFKV